MNLNKWIEDIMMDIKQIYDNIEYYIDNNNTLNLMESVTNE